MNTYRADPEQEHPCISVDPEGDLYVELSYDAWQDVYIKLSPEDKLRLAQDLIHTANTEIAEREK